MHALKVVAEREEECQVVAGDHVRGDGLEGETSTNNEWQICAFLEVRHTHADQDGERARPDDRQGDPAKEVEDAGEQVQCPFPL